jgi:hypothetical protein
MFQTSCEHVLVALTVITKRNFSHLLLKPGLLEKQSTFYILSKSPYVIIEVPWVRIPFFPIIQSVCNAFGKQESGSVCGFFSGLKNALQVSPNRNLTCKHPSNSLFGKPEIGLKKPLSVKISMAWNSRTLPIRTEIVTFTRFRAGSPHKLPAFATMPTDGIVRNRGRTALSPAPPGYRGMGVFGGGAADDLLVSVPRSVASVSPGTTKGAKVARKNALPNIQSGSYVCLRRWLANAILEEGHYHLRIAHALARNYRTWSGPHGAP